MKLLRGTGLSAKAQGWEAFQVIRLLYFSTARAKITRDDVDGIVAHAALKNKKLGITGALAYNGRNFCQVLEGRDDVVHELVIMIEEDTRHSGFKILDEKEIDKRNFPDWSMEMANSLDFSTVINAMND